MITRTLVALMLSLAPDGPFADLAYEAALAQAKEQQKLLLVDFTSALCGACMRMKADTWSAAEVVAWLGEHAIAIQVDVNKDKELAQQFGVESMHTIVVLRDDEELDRVVGYRNSNSFLAWAQGLAVGKRSIDEVMKRAVDLADSEDTHARYDLARDLLYAERYDLALEHYLWLWPATREVSPWGGVRLSYMLSEMADLGRKYPPAMEAFLNVLDGLQAQVAGEGIPEFSLWQEWSSMCEHFGEQQRMVAWYEDHRDADGTLFADRATNIVEEFRVQHIVGEVAEVLLEKNRPGDASRLFTDPYAYAEAAVTRFEEAGEALMNQELREENKEIARRSLNKQLVVVYSALLGAGRSEEAEEIGDLLLDTLDTPEARIALVSAGATVAQGPEESLERWLNEAETMGANVTELRDRLESLAEKKDK